MHCRGRALLSGDTRNATITALTKCTMLTLAREDFNQLLGSVDDLRGNLIRQGIIVSHFRLNDFITIRIRVSNFPRAVDDN